MLRMKFVVTRKAYQDILKRGDRINTWMCLCTERESYLGFVNRVGMNKIGKNIVRQKKMLREQYIWLWIKKLERH